ncbi:hypothetical protein C7212DRAFT_363527 [Tuber magnatum]|uniref:Mediator of RNA polymerase II transcription subunit 1 n=1 Tax=Tuber magnatum TaxID=42249 RepID=A0A317SQF6_9PEZI|nr:hypothetical protein C7212DRAFT_363527 [Tuber magnatum]
MTTPKMAGMTPNMGGAMSFSPALGQSPSHLLNLKHRPSAFNSPDMAALGGVPQISMPGDESKKKELGDILKLLAMRPGRISEEGVERLAKRMGLEIYKDGANGVLTMSLAAKFFLLDIVFKDNKVLRVTLNFENTPGPSEELAPLAASIFHANLSPSGVRAPLINPSLADFADNLERLTKADRLSCPPSLNCFTAITGLYRSLEKIYNHEKESLEGGSVGAMCKGNGRPRMHVRKKVGLSIDYWREKRIHRGNEDKEDDNEEIWRVLVEVEEMPPDFTNMNPITPVRTSDHWVSDEIKKPIEDNLFGESEDMVTDWLEPPLDGILDMTDTNARPPPARFIARLDPPVVVPFQNEIHLFAGLMLSPPPGLSVGALQEKLFPDAPSASGVQRRLYVPNNNPEEAEGGLRHEYRLHSLKPIFARQILEVPFSHPKELPGIFSILRQFAHVGALLKSCFSPIAGIIPKMEYSAAPSEGEEMELDAFLADGNDMADGVARPIPVDISVTEGQNGALTLGIIFPQKTGQGVVGCNFEVGRNADIRVTELSADDGKLGLDANGLEWALAIGSDLGIVVEWLRRKS